MYIHLLRNFFCAALATFMMVVLWMEKQVVIPITAGERGGVRLALSSIDVYLYLSCNTMIQRIIMHITFDGAAIIHIHARASGLG